MPKYNCSICKRFFSTKLGLKYHLYKEKKKKKQELKNLFISLDFKLKTIENQLLEMKRYNEEFMKILEKI